jgi:hypothetical protein
MGGKHFVAIEWFPFHALSDGLLEHRGEEHRRDHEGSVRARIERTEFASLDAPGKHAPHES